MPPRDVKLPGAPASIHKASQRIDWKSLIGRSIRIPIDPGQFVLGVVLYAESNDLLLYTFGPYTPIQIQRLNGQLPDWKSALTLTDVSGLAFGRGEWTIEESIPETHLPTEIPVIVRNQLGWGHIAADPGDVTLKEIVDRPESFEALRKRHLLPISGSEALVTVLRQVTTPIGERVPHQDDPSHWRETIDAAIHRLKARPITVDIGDVYKLEIENVGQVFAWVLNKTEYRVDVCFFRTNPADLSDQLSGHRLPDLALRRWVFFPGEWFRKHVTAGPIGVLDTSLLGNQERPVFRMTRLEYPSGRHDFAFEYAPENLWDTQNLVRIRSEEAVTLYTGSQLTEYGILEALISRLTR